MRTILAPLALGAEAFAGIAVIILHIAKNPPSRRAAAFILATNLNDSRLIGIVSASGGCGTAMEDVCPAVDVLAPETPVERAITPAISQTTVARTEGSHLRSACFVCQVRAHVSIYPPPQRTNHRAHYEPQKRGAPRIRRRSRSRNLLRCRSRSRGVVAHSPFVCAPPPSACAQTFVAEPSAR